MPVVTSKVGINLSDVASEIFKKYGALAIMVALFVAFSIWGLAHIAASPGTEVSVLWGLAKYTKPTNVQTANYHSSATQQQNKKEETAFKKEEPASKKEQVSDLLPIALEIQNNLSTKNYQKAIVAFRTAHKIRELNALESGKPASELPSGTYFFASVVYLEGRSNEDLKKHILVGSVDRFRSKATFEIHSLTGNGMHVVGFISESEVARISHLSGITSQEIVLAPFLWGSMTSLVSIPIDRIESSKYRNIQISNDEERMVIDLKVK
jgi:hypothetical protein